MVRKLNELEKLESELTKELDRKKEDLVALKYEIEKSEDTEEIPNLTAKVKELTFEIETTDKELFSVKTELNDKIKALNSMKQEVLKPTNDNSTDKMKELLSSESYKEAFATYLKTGNSAEVMNLTKAISTSTTGVNNGGVFVPTIISDMVIEASKKGGRIASLCREVKEKAYLEFPSIIARDGANNHAEGSASVAVQETEFGNVVIRTEMIKELVEVTDEMLDMTTDGFLKYLGGEIVEEILILLDNDILTRNISAPGAPGKGCRGIVTNGNINAVTKVVGKGVLDFTSPLSLIAATDDGIEENAVFVMNKSTFFNKVLTIVDTTGQPIYKSVVDQEGKTIYMLNGARVYFNSSLKSYDVASELDAVIVYGDFSKYTLNLPAGKSVMIKKDEATKMGEDIVRYLGRLNAGGDVTGYKAFSYLTKGVETP